MLQWRVLFDSIRFRFENAREHFCARKILNLRGPHVQPIPAPRLQTTANKPKPTGRKRQKHLRHCVKLFRIPQPLHKHNIFIIMPPRADVHRHNTPRELSLKNPTNLCIVAYYICLATTIIFLKETRNPHLDSSKNLLLALLVAPFPWTLYQLHKAYRLVAQTIAQLAKDEAQLEQTEAEIYARRRTESSLFAPRETLPPSYIRRVYRRGRADGDFDAFDALLTDYAIDACLYGHFLDHRGRRVQFDSGTLMIEMD